MNHPEMKRRPVGAYAPAIVAALAMLALLLAFQGLVGQIVDAAALRHAADAATARALWRCPVVPGQNLRAGC